MTRQSPLLSSAASISSVQSFETRQGTSTAATSIACSDDHRWSEVVPPESGLTFAVVWDPEEKDILAFSTAELSDSASPSFNTRSNPGLPMDAYENPSQVLTIGTSVPSEYTHTPVATLQFFRENFANDFLFAESTFFPDRLTRGRTQTSSTMHGLDVYLRGSMLGRAHNANRYYSCFQDLDGDFVFDPRTSFAKFLMGDSKALRREDVSDEGFFEGAQYWENEGNMSSRFSGTTTSTSNFITVENEMEDAVSTEWSALEAPNTPSYSRLLFTAPQLAPNRRLRKTRPIPGPASPSDVLHRAEYSHHMPLPTPGTPDTLRPHLYSQSRSRTPTPSSQSRSPFCTNGLRSLKLTMPKFARGLGTWKKTDTAGWVWIDVKGGSERAGSP